jgi:hypothetical protein
MRKIQSHYFRNSHINNVKIALMIKHVTIGK